jgi:preprotein translocase YajC subunit
MVEELKKGDRVMTIGGLVARVVSVEGDDVVLKIDESANVKATYRKSAIQQVLGGDEKTK